ncbi:MAG: hypothetical protein ABW168_05670 [Sedimenticola sp.]
MSFCKTTSYTITDETNGRSEIRMDKFIADTLQEILHDVHRFIQEIYDWVVKNYPYLSRLAKGNEVRMIASKKALESIYF